MNASRLVERVARRTGLSRTMVRSILDAAFDEITDTLASEERVSLSGFGSFEVRHRRARLGRNPNNGEAVPLPDRRAVLFHAGRGLRQGLTLASGHTDPALQSATSDSDHDTG